MRKHTNCIIISTFTLLHNTYVYVTGPEKTGLIYTKYTYSYNCTYLFLCVCYLISVSFIKFLRILYIYDEICVKMLCLQDEILHFKDRNLGQILHVDKTCFLRPGHIFVLRNYIVFMISYCSIAQVFARVHTHAHVSICAYSYTSIEQVAICSTIFWRIFNC